MQILFDGAVPFDHVEQPFDGPIQAPAAVASAVALTPKSIADGSNATVFEVDAAAAHAVAVEISPLNIVIKSEAVLDAPPVDWPPAAGMHFRLEDPVLGRLEMTCENGYIVREYEFSPPTVREVVYPNAWDDGTFDFTQFVGSRAVTLDVVLRPTENVDGTGGQRSEPQMRDALLAYAHPARRPKLTFSEHGDDRVREIDLRAADFSAAVSQPRFNSVSISWVAPRGLIQSSHLKCETQTMSTLAGVREFAVINQGNVNAHWTATIRGEIQMPIFYLNGDTSHALELEFSSQLQDNVTISSLDRTVRVNGVRTGYKFLSDNSEWFTIPPGSHVFNVASSDYTRAGYPFAKWENDGVAPVVTWGGEPPHLPAYDPSVPPPWAWTSEIDPNTGEASTTAITICYRSTWI